MQTYCPYRICPLGAHIDHQYGVVSGAAVDLGITLNYEPLDSPKIILSSLDYEGVIAFDIEDKLLRRQDWADYFRGVIHVLKKKYKLNQGLKGEFKADIPSGGISSSSASQIAFLSAICKLNDITLSKEEMIHIVFSVEHDYMGLSVGILDPSCEVLSKKDSLLFLDTLTNYHQIVENKEFNKKYQFLILYSGVDRKLIHSKYNTRVEELNNAYQDLNIDIKNCNKLRDIPDYFYERNKHKLNDIELKRSKHYFGEMERVKKGLRAWRHNDMPTFGRLMNESCLSSIHYYESGSIYLIDLFNATKEVDGVLGTRFLGAGFNGSSLALVEKDKIDSVIHKITKDYTLLHPELMDSFKIYPVTLSNGVLL